MRELSDSQEQLLQSLLLQTSRVVLSSITKSYNMIEDLSVFAEDGPVSVSDMQTAQLKHTFHKIHRMGLNLQEAAHPFVSSTKVNVNLVDLLEDFSRHVGPIVESLGRGYNFHCDLSQCKIAMNEDRFRRMLMNLLSNAVKFTPKGGEICLELFQDAACEEETVVLRITDTGCGMSEEELDNAFLRYTDENWKVDNRQGLGLGLPISRGIAQEHGGTLTLASQQGQGTEVTVTLPVKTTKLIDMHVCSFLYSGGFDPLLLELSDILEDHHYREAETGYL